MGKKTYGVTSEREVGLETHLVGLGNGRVDFTTSRVRASTAEGNTSTVEEDLKEELRVESEGRRVEGRRGVAGDDGVRASNRVRREELDDLVRVEAGIGETGEDGVDRVSRTRDEAILSRGSCVGTTDEELELGCTRAVAQTKGSSELDEIAGGDVVAREERREVVEALVGAVVLSESGLDTVEKND